MWPHESFSNLKIIFFTSHYPKKFPYPLPSPHDFWPSMGCMESNLRSNFIDFMLTFCFKSLLKLKEMVGCFDVRSMFVQYNTCVRLYFKSKTKMKCKINSSRLRQHQHYESSFWHVPTIPSIPDNSLRKKRLARSSDLNPLLPRWRPRQWRILPRLQTGISFTDIYAI